MSSSAVTASTNTVTINPTANLVTLEGYYILIDATAIDDASGNSYAGIGKLFCSQFYCGRLIASNAYLNLAGR